MSIKKTESTPSKTKLCIGKALAKAEKFGLNIFLILRVANPNV